MKIQFQTASPDQWHASVLIALCCENENLPAAYPDIDKAAPWLAIAPALRDFKGKNGELALLYGHPELKLPRVMALGLGKQADVTIADIRASLGRAARKCREAGLDSAILAVSNLANLPGGTERLAEECVYGFELGLYEFSQLKTEKNDLLSKPDWLAFGLDKPDDSLANAATRGKISAGAVCLSRDLANLPGNLLYPETLALRANELGQKHGFTCQIFAEEALQQMGAGCLLAVGQGSAHPPRLIVLEYTGRESAHKKPLVLVGKGITFDSGGLCLKPAANMNQMKCDMSGAGAVLATITAAAIEKVENHLVGILACAENMPDGRAYRPGDVLTALNGQTVEVINTDAEGRLALADALTYACLKYEPEAIIDVATLTGACAVALGNDLAGLFSNNEELANTILACGTAGGENCWRLPLWQKYRDSLKSQVADISHTASREGGAITAALFLRHFVSQDIPWAHLDIAGVDWVSKATPLCPEGASGFGTRILLALARRSTE